MSTLLELLDCSMATVSIFRNIDKNNKASLTLSISLKFDKSETSFTNFNAKLNSNEHMFKRGLKKNGEFISEEIEMHYKIAMMKFFEHKKISLEENHTNAFIRISKCYNSSHVSEKGLSVVAYATKQTDTFIVSIISGDEVFDCLLKATNSTSENASVAEYKEGRASIDMNSELTWMQKQALRKENKKKETEE